MKKLSVAIVGCGYVTEGHLKAWKKVSPAEVISVADLNESLAKNTAARWKIPNYFRTLSEALTNSEVNVVDICTPPQFHSELAIEAMENGRNVLIEKPMTITVSDAERIVKCQKKRGAIVGVLHNWLFDDSVITLRNRVSKGEIGDVLNIAVEALNRNVDSMVANKHHWSHKFHGGRFGEMLAHPVYLIRHFLGGEIEISSVQVSKLGDFEWMKSDELCATFKVGAKMGRTYVSFNSSRDAVYINLYGRKGIFKLDLINSSINFLPKMDNIRLGKGFDSLRQASQLVTATARNASKILLKTWSTGHDNYIRLFAQSLIDCGVPPVSAEEGLAVTKSVEAICDRIEEIEKSTNSVS